MWLTTEDHNFDQQRKLRPQPFSCHLAPQLSPNTAIPGSLWGLLPLVSQDLLPVEWLDGELCPSAVCSFEISALVVL